MIPMLIMYVLKRSKYGDRITEKIKVFKPLAIKVIVLLLLLLVTQVGAFNNSLERQSLTYEVHKKDKVIGTITINKLHTLDSTIYTLNSKINAKFVVRFNIEGSEKSVYKNDKLVYSSIYRKVNNKIKADHSISFRNGVYKLQASKKESQLNFQKIACNLITLYFKEPKGVIKVYCDNIKKMVPVKKIGFGLYKVSFSKDKYNIFHYKNGKCVKIEAYSSLFDVTLIPQDHV